MALTAPGGPLGTAPMGWFTPAIPEGTVYVEPHPRRIQGLVNGIAVIDTERALLVHRPDRFLRYAFPAAEVGDLPCRPEPTAPGYVLVPWNAVDTWLEEGRRLVNYPPNPYHRIDCHPTSRRLRVTVGDVVLVDTDETVIVFETTLEARLYVHPSLVRLDLLHKTDTSSWCDYKGSATFWAASADGDTFDDIAWSYDDPPPESQPIKGYLSFDSTRVQVIAELPEVKHR